jgi:hypothetical protein
MGKARVWGLLLIIAAARSEAAWAQSCAVGPVCVEKLDFDTLGDAVYYAQVVGITEIEVMEIYDPRAEGDTSDDPCARISLTALTDISVVALSDSVRWPGITLKGGSLSLVGGEFVGACTLSYDERVAVYDEESAESFPVLQSFTTAAQLIAVDASLRLDDVKFDYDDALSPDSSLGAIFLWDSSLYASAGTTVTGYPRQGAVELVADEADVVAELTEVTFSDNDELALVMRLSLSASMERLDSDGLPAEPRFDAMLTDVSFLSNSPGYGVVADIRADELASLSITRGLHIGTGDGIALYALDTWVMMTETVVNSYERGLSVSSADGIFSGAFDESDDVRLDVEDSAFTSIHNGDDHGGAITASSGDITLSGVTASDLSSKNAPFVKAYYASSLLVEDLTLTSFTVSAAPSAAIHAEQVDSVILRRVAMCDGQSSKTDAGGGLALYVNGRGGPNQSVEVHNLAFWGNRFGDGLYPAAVYAEDVAFFTVLHSSFVGSAEPTGWEAYAVKLQNSGRDRYDVTNNLIQGLAKGHYIAESYESPGNNTVTNYNLFYDVDVPGGTGLGSYDLSTSYVNTDAPGLWSPFNPLDCETPPLLGLEAFAIDKGDPDRPGEADGSPPDLGAYGGPYALVLPDEDGDGFLLGADCDDGDSTIYPGQVDRWIDGVDSNCDGIDALVYEPIEDGLGDDTAAPPDDTATPPDDTAAPPDDPLEFDYSGGRSCGGGRVDTGGAAGVVLVGALARRRRRGGGPG